MWPAGDGGLKAVLEMLHMLLEQPVWDASALDRAKQLYTSSFRSLPKSLERSTSFRLAQTLNGEDRCAWALADDAETHRWSLCLFGTALLVARACPG